MHANVKHIGFYCSINWPYQIIALLCFYRTNIERLSTRVWTMTQVFNDVSNASSSCLLILFIFICVESVRQNCGSLWLFLSPCDENFSSYIRRGFKSKRCIWISVYSIQGLTIWSVSPNNCDVHSNFVCL